MNYVDRMKEELEQLEERISKLASFIYSNREFKKLKDIKKDLMKTQLSIMEEYANILQERLEEEK